jgi:flavin-dependent dehydrogenase
MIREVAIVGGGPAGSICGARLAEAGFRVTLFDERLAWEKPCGGGLTHKALEAYPFLLNSAYPRTTAHRAELIASNGARVVLELEKPVVLYSRKVLNGMLLDRARAAGCRVLRARVTQLEPNGSRVTFRTRDQQHTAEFAVLAAGARNALLPGTTPLAAADLEMTVGYFLPAGDTGNGGNHSAALKIQFLENFSGYLWSFPRPGHLSVGICAPLAAAQHSTRGLRERVCNFIQREGLPELPTHAPSKYSSDSPVGFFSHVLPAPRPETLRRRPLAGRNWALIGDAAAWVDPLTGEGLYYAMRSGELLAQALIRGRPEEYEQQARREFLSELEAAGRMARRFFHGLFYGDWFQVRMVQMLRHSATLRRIASDLFAGAQDYGSLKRRLRSRAGRVLWEVLLSWAGIGASPRSNGPIELQ